MKTKININAIKDDSITSDKLSGEGIATMEEILALFSGDDPDPGSSSSESMSESESESAE